MPKLIEFVSQMFARVVAPLTIGSVNALPGDFYDSLEIHERIHEDS
jgi:hypothetical protein